MINILRNLFRSYNAHKAQDIRESYYKAAEGLIGLRQSLFEMMEELRSNGASKEVLKAIETHYEATLAAETAFEDCKLGAVL
jgi:hypothetical protein